MNMPTNEDGEFELVLGNKQLLSVFFIFIVLLGVFFTMGYLVGRNSGPVDVAARKAGAEPGVKTEAPSAMASKSVPKPLEVAPAKEEPLPQAPAAQAETSQPIPTPAPAPVVAKKEAAVEKPKPLEISPVTSSKAAPAGIHEPAPGMYVQVLALEKAPAEVLADVLAKKGFHSLVAPGPNERIFRVLVGPAKDQADAARLKGDLEKAGFKEAFPKRY